MRRALAHLLVLVALLMFVPVGTASAIPGVCSPDAPAPATPGSGGSGFFGTPERIPQDPDDGAWANGAPIYENYGSNMVFNTYDLGCAPDIGATVGTFIANGGFEVSKFGVAAVEGMLSAAYDPGYLSVFDPMLVEATEVLRTAIFSAWLPLSLAVIGLIMLWGARSSKMAATTAAAMWALLVMVAASAVFAWPVQAGSAADETIGAVLGGVNDGINGTSQDPVQSAAGSVSNAVLFEQWKMGTFGRSNSETAEDYAREIFTATHLTWEEAALLRSDPDGAGADMLDAKADLFEDTAETIKDTDPGAYKALTGQDSASRIGAMFVSIFALVLAAPFLIASALLIIGAYLVIRFAVVFFPVIATFGVIYALRGAVKGVALVVGAAIGNAIMFGVAAAVTILYTRIILSPSTGLPLWLALTLLGVGTFVMWFATKPFRKLTAMASPSRFFGDAAGAVGTATSKVQDATMSAAKMAGAAYVGNAAAIATMTDEATRREPRTEAQTETPEPEPDPTVTVTATRVPNPGPTQPMPGPGPGGAMDSAGQPAQALPVGSPTPTEDTKGPASESTTPTTTPTATPAQAALPAAPRPSDPAPDPEVAEESFVPGVVTIPEQTVPQVAEPYLDADGDEVYPLFTPDDENADSAP